MGRCYSRPRHDRACWLCRVLGAVSTRRETLPAGPVKRARDEIMGYRDERYMVSLSLVDDNHIVHADLTSEEREAIGYVITQWALLEHIILIHTIHLAQSANAPVPANALNKSFDKRSDAWRLSIEKHVTDPKERERLLALYKQARDAEDRRHKVAHGVWTWAEGNPTRLLACSFHPDFAFEHGFDLDRLRKLGNEIGAIGFQIEYPGGKDEAWRVGFESCADENGQVSYVSRAFLLEMKKKDP